MTEKEKAPMIDQDGKMINPHNPDFITKVPWYLGNNQGPTLKHHNIQKKDHVLSLTEADRLIESKIVAQKQYAESAPKTVFRKGACKNCGAMTHKEKDCLERPRSAKRSAWKTGVDIAADEVVLKLEDHGKVSYAAKRDQWKGYDPREYQEVISRHERIQKEKQEQKGKLSTEENDGRKNEEGGEGNGKTSEDSDSGSDYESDGGNDDEARAHDDQARNFQGTIIPQGGVGGNGMRVTVRNLRLREDTPKYLRNLSLDSAFYDPKSRSMRSNPFPNANPEDLPFAGDNFVRYSGDAVKLAQNQVLCWEMQEKGETAIDVISNPSQAELLHKQFTAKKEVVENEKKKAILEKYADGKANPSLDPRLRLGQTESYVEYGPDGRPVKEIKAISTKTKYEEDVFINNHTSVWGSYYNRMQGSWGYACCHSLIKNSICVGSKGFEANKSLFTGKPAAAAPLTKDPATSSSSSGKIVSRSEMFGEANPAVQLSEDKVKEKLSKWKEDKHQGKDDEADGEGKQSKKRSYNSMQSQELTPEDMEVYRMTKFKSEDPMAQYRDEEE